MADDEQPVHLTAGLPETVLPESDPAVTAGLEAAGGDLGAIEAVVAANPRSLDGWAAYGEAAAGTIQRYAAFRVGYHRGLDALRANGWRGTGYVRWSRPSNRPFLRCLAGLRDAAAEIGERDEVERIDTFLRQLDPDWDRREGAT